MIKRWTISAFANLAVAVLGGGLLCTALAAQDPQASGGDPAPAAAAQDGSAAEAYQAKLAEWKQLLKDLRALRTEFLEGEDSQRADVRRRWAETIARGQTMIPELRAAAEKAYLAAPNVDLSLTRFLVESLRDLVAGDDYDPAYELANTLVDHDCGVDGVYDPAGIAAFAVNDYEKAEKYLKEADATDSLSDNGRKLLDSLADYQKYWTEEKKLREAEAQADDLPRVRLETNKGDIVIELLENEAPETVGNFVSLVESGFYNGLMFHRVLPNFMAQGGCPTGDGTGGPGYRIYCELKGDNYRRHFRGSLSMAHAGRDTGGSQFFLTFLPTPHLNGEHTVFGRVIEGMDVLPKLQRRDPDSSSPPEADKIIKAEVIRKRDHPYAPNKVQ